MTAAIQENMVSPPPDSASSQRLGTGGKHHVTATPHDGGGNAVGRGNGALRGECGTCRAKTIAGRQGGEISDGRLRVDVSGPPEQREQQQRPSGPSAQRRSERSRQGLGRGAQHAQDANAPPALSSVPKTNRSEGGNPSGDATMGQFQRNTRPHGAANNVWRKDAARLELGAHPIGKTSCSGTQRWIARLHAESWEIERVHAVMLFEGSDDRREDLPAGTETMQEHNVLPRTAYVHRGRHEVQGSKLGGTDCGRTLLGRTEFPQMVGTGSRTGRRSAPGAVSGTTG